MKNMNRRDFMAKISSAAAVLGLWPVLAACGGGSSYGAGSGGNHIHTLVINCA